MVAKGPRALRRQRLKGGVNPRDGGSGKRNEKKQTEKETALFVLLKHGAKEPFLLCAVARMAPDTRDPIPAISSGIRRMTVNSKKVFAPKTPHGVQ